MAIAALLVAALLASLAPFADAAGGGSRNPNVITDWNKIGVDLIVADATIGGTARAFNYFAYEQAAVYNAVVGITRRYQLYQWSQLGPRGASPAAAAVAAAHRILVHYFPGSQVALDNAYRASIHGIPRGLSRRHGITYGEQAAANIIELRAHDGLKDPSVTFTMPVGIGVWRGLGTPPQQFLAPWLSEVHPFTLTSTSQFDPGPPPALNSPTYTADFIEVKAKGGATGGRSVAEEQTAKFFYDTAVGPLQGGLRDLATRHHLDISDSARMFAAVDLSIADAIGTVWKAKVQYGFWRPISAIREAADDGNDLTIADPSWNTFLGTPPYPDWVSGLCSVYGAAGRALRRVIGRNIDLRITSTLAGETRTYHSASVLNTDAINARVWSGIHFRFADVGGSHIGVQVANWALDHNFGPSQ